MRFTPESLFEIWIITDDNCVWYLYTGQKIRRDHNSISNEAILFYPLYALMQNMDIEKCFVFSYGLNDPYNDRQDPYH